MVVCGQVEWVAHEREWCVEYQRTRNAYIMSLVTVHTEVGEKYADFDDPDIRAAVDAFRSATSNAICHEMSSPDVFRTRRNWKVELYAWWLNVSDVFSDVRDAHVKHITALTARLEKLAARKRSGFFAWVDKVCYACSWQAAMDKNRFTGFHV
jgi:hypothetical protein